MALCVVSLVFTRTWYQPSPVAVNPHPGEGLRTRELFDLDPLYPVARLPIALWVPLSYGDDDFHTIDDLPEDRVLVV